MVFPDHTHLPFCGRFHGFIRACISDSIAFNVAVHFKIFTFSMQTFMHRLHLPRSSYDFLSTILSTIFSASQAAISYDVCVYIANDQLTISFGDKLGLNLTETLQISYDNRKVIV